MKKVLATLLASAAMMVSALGVQASENAIFNDDFNDADVVKWFGYTVNNSSVKIRSDGNLQLNTSGLGKEALIATDGMAMENNGASHRNQYRLADMIGSAYKVETKLDVKKMAQGNMNSSETGVYAFKQSIFNTHYNMQYAVCADGIWVYNAGKTWNKAIDITNSDPLIADFSQENQYRNGTAVYNITAEADGATARITVEHESGTYTYEWVLPVVESTDPPSINNIRMSSLSVGAESGYNMVFVDSVKLSNVFDDEVLYDDAVTLDMPSSYGSNITVAESGSLYANKYKYISLKDMSIKEGADNKVYYSLPEGTKLRNFYIHAMNSQYNQTNNLLNIYGVKDGVETKLSPEKMRAYVSNWSEFFKMSNDILSSGYDGLAIELLADAGPAHLMSVQLDYAAPYEIEEGVFTAVPSKEEVLIDDDFSSQKWAAIGGANYGLFLAFDSKNESGAQMKVTRTNGNDPTYVIPGYIKEHYKDVQKFDIRKLPKENPETAGEGFGIKKTIVNGKYELTYAVCYDGLWVKNGQSAWEKVKDIVNPEALYENSEDYSMQLFYEIEAEANGGEATLRFKYQDEKNGEYKTFSYTYDMPETADVNNVIIESKVIDNANGRTEIYITENKLVNIYNGSVLIDDTQKKYDFVTYGPNVELTAYPSSSYSQNAQIDLIEFENISDRENNNYVRYNAPENGRITDFNITRRLDAQKQGSFYIRLITAAGDTAFLQNSDLIIKHVYLNTGHAYYYMPTDALKEKMASGNYVAVKCVLSDETGAMETSPALLRGVIECEIPEAYELRDGYIDVFDGNASFVGQVKKNISSAPDIQIIIASYDENGKLIEVGTKGSYDYVSEFAMSQTIKAGASYKVFFWETGNDGEITQTPVIPAYKQ